MVHKERGAEAKLEFVGEVIPFGELFCGMEPLEPLKCLACHVESCNCDSYVIGSLLKCEEMVDLKYQAKSIFAVEHKDIKFWESVRRCGGIRGINGW